MSQAQLPTEAINGLLRCLSRDERAIEVKFGSRAMERYIPRRLEWQPTLCVKRGERRILVHALVSLQVPEYVRKAVMQLRKKKFRKTDVIILARQVTTEGTEESDPCYISAVQVAGDVAADCQKMGAGLLMETENEVYEVFRSNYCLPRQYRSGEETGHIPKWLYEGVASNQYLSPYLARTFRAFAKQYKQATNGNTIAYIRECDLLAGFARRFARGDRRLLFPLGQLDILREYELSGAKKGGRDHFFHTFNNLFLGFYILGLLSKGRKHLAEVDRFISDSKKPRSLRAWEVLWFLTCLFHDPAYIAEDPWGAFRFVYGAEEDASARDSSIPGEWAREIPNLWETVFAQTRKDLRALYNRTVRKWLPPTLKKKKDKDFFDASLRAVYFDGRRTSHSVISAFKLIHSCRPLGVPQSTLPDKEIARTSSVIAALCMLFHDQRTREMLERDGIGPIAFEKLPYAATLMFVDCLQDDRRDITCARFRELGLLKTVEVCDYGTAVRALVCLREVPISGWPKRIAEYESVMRWINMESDVNFQIDYRRLAGL